MFFALPQFRHRPTILRNRRRLTSCICASIIVKGADMTNLAIVEMVTRFLVFIIADKVVVFPRKIILKQRITSLALCVRNHGLSSPIHHNL